MKLFLDTTFGITVGLLNNENEWLDYEFIEGQKGSAVIHKLIKDLLDKNDLDIESVSILFQIAGPGSYTGMRVSDGISQIFNWQNIKTFSFYHFDIPRIVGVESGVWFANAFKGEVFLYSWSGESFDKKLLKEQEAFNMLKDSDIPIFSSFTNDKAIFEYSLTKELIHENCKLVFSYIEEANIQKELYYFRTIDEEFSRGKNNGK